jgi:hypothetical protein
MPIWKLVPDLTSASDDAWAFTRWYGSVVVRAKNPKQARQVAAEAFRKAHSGESDPDQTSLISPWLDDGLVVCRRVAVSTYRPDGPDQVLQPHASEYGRA